MSPSCLSIACMEVQFLAFRLHASASSAAPLFNPLHWRTLTALYYYGFISRDGSVLDFAFFLPFGPRLLHGCIAPAAPSCDIYLQNVPGAL